MDALSQDILSITGLLDFILQNRLEGWRGALASLACALLRDYQKKNNITTRCIDNCQTLYHIMCSLGFKEDVKVKSVILLSATKIVYGHLVLEFDGTNIDPSYECYSLKGKKYIDTIKDLLDNVYVDKDHPVDREIMKMWSKQFLHFTGIAEQINKGELRITNKEYYNKQADYVEPLLFKYYQQAKQLLK